MDTDDSMSAKTLDSENKTLVVEAGASSELGNGVVKIVQTEIVETEVFDVGEGEKLETLGVEGGKLEDADMKGVSSLLGLSSAVRQIDIEEVCEKEGERAVDSVLPVEENGEKGIKELAVDSVLAVEENGEKGIKELAVDSVLPVEENGEKGMKELAVEENGEKGMEETEGGSGKCSEADAPLEVDNGSLPKTDEGESKNSGDEAKLEVDGDSSPQDGDFNELKDGEEVKLELNSDSSAKDGDFAEMNDPKDGEDSLPKNGIFDEVNGPRDGDDGDNEYEFTVGDFVWCRSNSHLWWPGMIYDHSDASDYAAKLKVEDGFLVAYFGDDTFTWCQPFQLKPFEENFEEFSKLSQSKNFVNAVQSALDVISRLVESKLICPCLPEQIRFEIDRPVAENAGIKENILVPEAGIRKISVAEFDPGKLLSKLKSTAHDFSLLGTLEFTVLKSCLSAFYLAKGGYKLPSFYGAQPVPGLEDNAENGKMKTGQCNFSVEIPVPGPFVDDWHLPSPSQNMLQKCSVTSDGRIHPRRKRKSIVEIMGRASNVPAEGNISGRRKRKGSDDIDGQTNGNLSSKQKKKKKTMQDEELIAEDDNNDDDDHENKDTQQSEEEADDGSNSVEKKMNRSLSTKSDDSAVIEQSGRSLSRERKLSKYLCPPFTTLIHSWSPRSKNPETASPRIYTKTRAIEQITKAADSLVNGSPTSPTHGQKRNSKGHDEEGTAEHMKGQASPHEVLCEIRSAALNPSDPIENEEFDLVREFLSAFRHSVFSEERNGKVQNRKRKAEFDQIDDVSPEVKSQSKKIRKNQEQSGTLELEQAIESSSGKKSETIKDKHKKPSELKSNTSNINEEISSSSLLVSFGPGSSLPTKEELIKIYSRFGPLNLEETDMFTNNFCALIVFARSTDAEEALKDSQKASPFGSSGVSFKLLSSSETPKVQKKSEKAGSSKEVNGKDRSSQLKCVKEKLELLTSMVEKSDGEIAPQLKSKLQGEMKGLVAKLDEMVASFSF